MQQNDKSRQRHAPSQRRRAARPAPLRARSSPRRSALTQNQKSARRLVHSIQLLPLCCCRSAAVCAGCCVYPAHTASKAQHVDFGFWGGAPARRRERRRAGHCKREAGAISSTLLAASSVAPARCRGTTSKVEFRCSTSWLGSAADTSRASHVPRKCGFLKDTAMGAYRSVDSRSTGGTHTLDTAEGTVGDGSILVATQQHHDARDGTQQAVA